MVPTRPLGISKTPLEHASRSLPPAPNPPLAVLACKVGGTPEAILDVALCALGRARALLLLAWRASVLTAQSGALPNRRCPDMPTRRGQEVFTGSESYLHTSSRLVQCKSVRARCGPCGELVHTPRVAHSKNSSYSSYYLLGRTSTRRSYVSFPHVLYS